MREKSPHILNASTNLLGFCFVVITSLKLLKIKSVTRIDEMTSITILFLMISVIFSFFSIRGGRPLWERIAEAAFLIAILTLFITTLVITFDLMK
jgi:membrane protein YdbS with pleckstrin-like domain